MSVSNLLNYLRNVHRQTHRALSLLLGLVLAPGMVACDDKPKEAASVVDSGATIPAEMPPRPASLDASWIEVEPELFAIRFAFPRQAEPELADTIFEGVTARQTMWRVAVPKVDADYSVRVLQFAPDLDKLNDSRTLFEWQQARLGQEIEGDFEAAEYRLEGKVPSVDLRFTVDRSDEKGVAFARFVRVGETLYELMVQTSRDSRAPVAPFMQSLIIKEISRGDLAPAGCGCRFAMPASTEPRAIEFELPDGTPVEAKSYLHNVPDRPIAFSVAYASVADGRLLDFAPRKVMNHLAQKIAERVDGEVADTASIKTDGRAGLEAAIVHTVAGKRKALVRAQIFVSGSKIHIVEVAMLDPRFAESARVQNFLKSFEFDLE